MSQRGSLLIELLIGTGLLATGLFAIFLGLVTLTDTLERNTQLGLATTLASNRIAEFRAIDTDTIALGTTTMPSAALPNGSIVTTVSSVSAELKDVVVRVAWTDGAETRSVELVTRVATNGLESL